MIELSLVDLLVGGLVVYGMNENVAQNDKDIVIYRQRNMEGLNQDTVDAIRLITFSDNTDPVGSFKYKIHRYPGDVDIFEPVKICCTKDKAIATISTELQRIAQKVKNHKTVYWGDFKAGMDLAFKPQESETFEHYRSRINISKTELDNLRDDFPESTRSLYIIRWTADDVIKGFKILKSKKKLTLQEAITHDSVVKLDLWAPINGNYTEVTNLFLFIWVEADGTEHVLNAKLADRLESLNKDIAKYSNIDHYNPLKLAKRMWIKALLLNNSRITKILAPLFASGAAQLNQIIGESETIRAMFQKLSNPPMNVELMMSMIFPLMKNLCMILLMIRSPQRILIK